MVVESAPAKVETSGDEHAVMGRRTVLRSVALGAATLLVLGDGLIAYRAYDQGVFGEGQGPAFLAVQDWKTYKGPVRAVAAAVLAASAHNTQPWAFAVSHDRIDVFADPRRTTGANDPLGREFHISLGCALENLVLGAHANGYETEVELDPGGVVDLLATGALRTAPALTTELYDAIGIRRSKRSEHSSDLLPTGTLKNMAGLVDQSVSPAQLMFQDQEPGRRKFGELLVEATRAHVADEEQSLASFAW